MSADDEILNDDSAPPESPDGTPAAVAKPADGTPSAEDGVDSPVDTAAESSAPEAGDAGLDGADATDEAPTDVIGLDEAAADAPEAEPAQEPEPEAMAFRYTEKYYAPVSPEAPAGKEIAEHHFTNDLLPTLDWERDEDFGRPDPARRPTFNKIRDKALGFLDGAGDNKATRDVRPLLALLTAEAGDKGPVGLAKALDLFVATTTSIWHEIYPQEDDGDFLDRLDAMSAYFNVQIILMAVDDFPIAKSPRVGALTTRTFGIASTKINARDNEFAPTTDALDALFAEEEEALEGVKEAHAAYVHAVDRLREMDAFLEANPIDGKIEFALLADRLEAYVGYLAPYIGGAEATSVDAEEDGDGGGPSAAGHSGPITGAKSFDEAMAIVDDILRFYARSGRSSPVPLGLIALRDLVASDFNNWIMMTASGGLGSAAINLSNVDASRLSEFVSGESPSVSAQSAPAVDFSEFDSKIYYVTEAIASLEHGLKNIELANPPAEPAEGADSVSYPWDYDVQALKDSIEALKGTRTAMEPVADDSADENSGSGENGAKGDGDHSRITNRNDVKSSLDAVAAYFEREEPSSPAPAYLRRLKGLVDARFDEIARELMPEEGGEAKLQLEPRTKLR